MKWLEEANLSSDGRNLTGKYTMSDTKVTIPGNQEVIFVLKVKNAVNGTKIQPTFTFMLEGNEENEKKEVKAPKEITVSATGRYNIKLLKNARLSRKVSIIMNEDDNIETTGRIYGFGIILQLYNENESKKLKGIQYPKEDITFNIETKLERSSINNSSNVQDITTYCTPILYDYKINENKINGVLGRDMNFGNDVYGWLYNDAPNGVVGNRDETVYDSGNINMLQNGNIINTTISDYDFDGIFPSYNASSAHDVLKYTDNIGCFSVAYFQIFVPDNEYSTDSDYNYYLTIKDKDFKVSINSDVITNQQVTDDDSVTVQHFIHKAGTYSQDIRLNNVDINPFPVYYYGNGATSLGDEFIASIGICANTNNDEENTIYTVNKLIKFDGNGYEPYLDNNGQYYLARTDEFTGIEFTYKMWFVTKKDGTNWLNQDEMNNTDIENLIMYENYEDIPEGYICVGEYFETQTGYLTNGYQWTVINLKVKSTANIGQTYSIISDTTGWKEQLDRNIYSSSLENVKWPEAEFEIKSNYIKTEYDENGQIKPGTHNSSAMGQSLLIIGVNLHGDIKAVDSNNIDKINYDLGKNENIVTYSVEPQLDGNENLQAQIEDVILKAEVKLPKGLEYVQGSSKRGKEEYTEPEITENSDGSTSLVWYIYGVTSGEKIIPITFDSKIYNVSEDGTQYETTFIISEQKGEDGISKIGNSEISKRTSTVTINIINLASFRVYKEVENQVIDKNGEIHYTITGKNTSETGLPEFVLLDIMPYNEDGRGTTYNGKYTISKIKITKNKDEKEIENDFKLYITKSTTKSGQGDQYEQIKKLNVKDQTIGNTTTNTGNTTNANSVEWEELQETNGEYIINREQANDGITAIAVKGELETQTEIAVDIYIKTEENKAEDKYVNSATAQTESLSEVVQTSQEYAQVLERIISGKVWLDENYNNIIDNNESLERLINNVNSGHTSQNEENTENTNTTETTENNENILIEEITLKLYKVKEDKSLEEAKDIDGAIIPEIHPNAKGYYEFRGLQQGNYVVKIEYNGEKYKLSEKEVQDNKEITSKFIEEEKGKGKTEEITKLNSSANLKIEENNINAGLIEIINLEFTKVAEEDHANKIGGTEFKLYKLVCTEHEDGYHDTELINPQNVKNVESDEIENTEKVTNNTQNIESTENLDNNCWQLVDTQTSKIAITNENQGTVKFEDLEINQEYRLVETKASINRIKPEGQWKIEFSLIDEAEIQENNTEITKINNGVEIKIESIGEKEPPAFAITKNGETGIIEELLLPNRAYFQFPASGSIGSKTIYKIGLSILMLGIFILITRNKSLLKNTNNYKGKM